VAAVRKIGKPFYAGLAAYGYTILYSKGGDLVELRGNIDPAAIAVSAGLELVDRSRFGDEEDGEIRYEFRAIRDLIFDGLIVEPGQTIVVDQPSSTSLRAAGSAVRKNAGEMLLGISIFRLPSEGDETMLSIEEVARALRDGETIPSTELHLHKSDDKGRIEISIQNSGTAASLLGTDALTIDIQIPAGRFKQLQTIAGLSRYELLCQRGRSRAPEKCSPQRANLLRLRSNHWRPGDTALALIDLGTDVPTTLRATTTMLVDDGRVMNQHFELDIKSQ
jgi:hypothetical protein